MSADGSDLFNLNTLPAGDDGMTEMVIFVNPRTKKVIQRFARPMSFVAYTPENLVPIAGQMLDCVQELGFKVALKQERRKITEQQRNMLVTRAMHIQRTVGSQNPAKAARMLVDAILSSID